eukprot:14645998-Alexandrium_andersonii.AAC.1
MQEAPRAERLIKCRLRAMARLRPRAVAVLAPNACSSALAPGTSLSGLVAMAHPPFLGTPLHRTSRF